MKSEYGGVPAMGPPDKGSKMLKQRALAAALKRKRGQGEDKSQHKPSPIPPPANTVD